MGKEFNNGFIAQAVFLSYLYHTKNIFSRGENVSSRSVSPVAVKQFVSEDTAVLLIQHDERSETFSKLEQNQRQRAPTKKVESSL